MAEQQDSVPGRLKAMFMYNSSWGPREGEEHNKVVWYHPADEEVNRQVKTVGLIEAVVTFHKNFTASPAEALHTQKTRTVFREVEPGFWLCMTVAVPFKRRSGSGGQSDDDGVVVEFSPADLNDNVLLAVLQRAYDMLGLFTGGVEAALEEAGGDKTQLMQKLDHFFTRYLATLRVERADLLSAWGGIQYFALGQASFLGVRSFVGRVGEELGDDLVAAAMFLHQGQLVWSGLGRDTTRLLLHYLTTTLLADTSTLGQPPAHRPQGRFLVGPTARDPRVSLPVVHVGEERRRRRQHLLVYHAINSTVCLLLHAPPDAATCRRFDESVGPRLADLSADLTHVWMTRAGEQQGGGGGAGGGGGGGGPDDQVRFLYFNETNLAVKTTAHADSSSDELLKLATDLVCDGGDDVGEVTVKLATDQWVVVHRARERAVVVLLQQKNINLMEVSEEVAKLFKSSFDAVCMV